METKLGRIDACVLINVLAGITHLK